ncbi:MAG: hypothetical protein E7271_07160 [Lachnospiraceae bacterium]|nr:hypothetical protein [Lachnospiraceae bacterium]
MSKVLVIPDVHLKPWIFDQAVEIMVNTDCERAVCVGDVVDDWDKQKDVRLYEKTLDKMLDFARRYPDTLWCMGNHDLSYLWEQYDHPGYSVMAADMVVSKFEMLKDIATLPEYVGIIHRLDNTIFSHAGLCKDFVLTQLGEMMGDIDCMLDTINGYGVEELWENNSPIWVRPQYGRLTNGLYSEGLLQVVGHTPVMEILVEDGIITVDTFSTYPNGRPLGNQVLCWIDTVSKEYGLL